VSGFRTASPDNPTLQAALTVVERGGGFALHRTRVRHRSHGYLRQRGVQLGERIRPAGRS